MTFDAETNAKICYQIFKEYDWLMDCYVLDFFTERHWDRLPDSLKQFLNNLNLNDIKQLLDGKRRGRKNVFPLSIIVLKLLLEMHALPRAQRDIKMVWEVGNDTAEVPLLIKQLNSLPRLKQMFWKKVKEKKQHEIELLAQLCYSFAKQYDCLYIVDVGSGLGHLSRLLSYGYDLKVCSLEAQQQLTEQAVYLDVQFENSARRYLQDLRVKNQKPVHINLKIDHTITAERIVELVKGAFNLTGDNFKIGLIGLHPCGDLGSMLLRLYKNSPQIHFINIASCCYMKLSTPFLETPHGYPLSLFYNQNQYFLSYPALEVACHAVEKYLDKLRHSSQEELKIHAYRATIEKVIRKTLPDLKHCALASVSYTCDLTFSDYCKKALKKLQIKLDEAILQSEEVVENLRLWERVVKFYALRLMVAPLLETIILLDRLLFMREAGSRCDLIPLFNPSLSPRNQVLVATKTLH